MRTRELHEDGLDILAIEGEIDLSSSPELRGILRAYVKAKCLTLILDFKEVSYVDSSALATLIEYVRDAQGFGGRMAIVQLNERVRTIFDMVRLGEFFPLHPTIAEARAALLVPPAA
jgi:anti-sigma B factor antagonist